MAVNDFELPNTKTTIIIFTIIIFKSIQKQSPSKIIQQIP